MRITDYIDVLAGIKHTKIRRYYTKYSMQTLFAYKYSQYGIKCAILIAWYTMGNSWDGIFSEGLRSSRIFADTYVGRQAGMDKHTQTG